MSEMNFGCFDIILWGLKMFVCEIYRVFNGFQIFYFGNKIYVKCFYKVLLWFVFKKGIDEFLVYCYLVYCNLGKIR